MNYKRIYEALILRAKGRVLEGYCEKHHVLPKCMGGTNDPENIVKLTPEEHFVAHQLLVKIHPDNHSLALAASKMCVSSRMTSGRMGRKMYGWVRRRHAKSMSYFQSNKRNSQYGSRWITDGTENKKLLPGESLPDGWEYGRYYPDSIKTSPKYVCPSCGGQKSRKASLCQGCNPNNHSTGRYKVPDEELLEALVANDWRYPTAFKSLGLTAGSNYKRARRLEKEHRHVV